MHELLAHEPVWVSNSQAMVISADPYPFMVEMTYLLSKDEVFKKSSATLSGLENGPAWVN